MVVRVQTGARYKDRKGHSFARLLSAMWMKAHIRKENTNKSTVSKLGNPG